MCLCSVTEIALVEALRVTRTSSLTSAPCSVTDVALTVFFSAPLQLMRQCDDEELMEVVLPRLSKVITTYEFLLMRVERGKPLVPHVQDVLVEFEKLHKQVRPGRGGEKGSVRPRVERGIGYWVSARQWVFLWICGYQWTLRPCARRLELRPRARQWALCCKPVWASCGVPVCLIGCRVDSGLQLGRAHPANVE